MKNLRLCLLQGGLVLTALLYTAIASADPGTIVLVTGQVVVGEVSQVATGEYIMITLPSGEVKAIAWAQIGTFQIGASATVSTGNPTAAPPPAPPPDNTPPPTYTPPPPPPPNYGGYGYGSPPPPPPPPAPEFVPAWMVGLRLGSLVPSGDITGSSSGGTERRLGDYATSGWSFEGNVGMHLSPAFTLYGLWEYGEFGRPATTTESASLNTVGGGLNVNSNGRGTVGFLFDAALAYRWLAFSVPTVTTDVNTGATMTTYDKATASGAVLRLGMGLAINATKKFRIDLLGNVTFGSFREFKGAGLEGSDPGSHATFGLTAGGRWDL